jgi:hypothetical protein
MKKMEGLKKVFVCLSVSFTVAATMATPECAEDVNAKVKGNNEVVVEIIPAVEELVSNEIVSIPELAVAEEEMRRPSPEPFSLQAILVPREELVPEIVSLGDELILGAQANSVTNALMRTVSMGSAVVPERSPSFVFPQRSSSFVFETDLVNEPVKAESVETEIATPLEEIIVEDTVAEDTSLVGGVPEILAILENPEPITKEDFTTSEPVFTETFEETAPTFTEEIAVTIEIPTNETPVLEEIPAIPEEATFEEAVVVPENATTLPEEIAPEEVPMFEREATLVAEDIVPENVAEEEVVPVAAEVVLEEAAAEKISEEEAVTISEEAPVVEEETIPVAAEVILEEAAAEKISEEEAVAVPEEAPVAEEEVVPVAAEVVLEEAVAEKITEEVPVVVSETQPEVAGNNETVIAETATFSEDALREEDVISGTEGFWEEEEEEEEEDVFEENLQPSEGTAEKIEGNASEASVFPEDSPAVAEVISAETEDMIPEVPEVVPEKIISSEEEEGTVEQSATENITEVPVEEVATATEEILEEVPVPTEEFVGEENPAPEEEIAAEETPSVQKEEGTARRKHRKIRTLAQFFTFCQNYPYCFYKKVVVCFRHRKYFEPQLELLADNFVERSDAEQVALLTIAMIFDRYDLFKKMGEQMEEFIWCNDELFDYEPLHCAALMGELRYVRFMVKKCGGDVNDCDLKERTPLMIAANRGDIPMVQFLLSQEKINVNHRDYHRRSALDYALRKNNAEIVNLLKAKGAEFRTDENGDILKNENTKEEESVCDAKESSSDYDSDEDTYSSDEESTNKKSSEYSDSESSFSSDDD